MTCREIENRLPAYREDLLSPEEKSAIENHLSFCNLCRRSLTDMEMAENLLKSLKEVEPPPFFEQKIMARVREESGRGKGLFQKFFFPIHIKIPIQAMATLLIAVLAVYIYQKSEPERKQMKPFPAPLSEPAKGQVAAESPKSPKTPATVTHPTQAPARALLKKDQPPFAAAPPTVVSRRTDRAAELTGPREEEKSAAEKAGNAIMALRDKEDSLTERPALSKTQERVEKKAAGQTFDAPGPERKGEGPLAEKGVPVEKSMILKSAPAPSRFVGAAGENRTALELTIRVRDTNVALRKIEERLSREGARIIERTHRDGKEFLKAEMTAQKVALFLDHLEAVGRVVFDKEPFEVQEGEVTVSIHIVTYP